MARQLVTKWRQSASLLMLARDSQILPKTFNYNVLLFQRTAKATFMPNSMVFPGGVRETADTATEWLQHFEGFGINAEHLRKLAVVHSARPSMLEATPDDMLPNSLALRITAIRETFEEVGVLICRDRATLKDASGYGHFKEDFEREYWQQLVHNDAQQFLILCQQLDVVPDLWSLYEWSVWLTPSTFKKRFETAFFMTALQSQPNLLAEHHEVSNYTWRTPIDYLKAFIKKELWLPPPQYYELARCLHHKDLSDLRTFAEQRVKHGLELIHPVFYECTDGEVHVLPGDDYYPANPDASSKPIKTGVSIDEFRARVRKIHRSEHRSLYNLILHKNYPSADGHLYPLDPRELIIG